MKVAAILLNFFVPGVGSLVAGQSGAGIAQLLLYFVGVVFTVTLVGAILGIPMMLGAWIWGLVTAAGVEDAPAVPAQVHVVHVGHPGLGAQPAIATDLPVAGAEPHGAAHR